MSAFPTVEEFFFQAVLRLTSSQQIHKAITALFYYCKPYFPTIGVSLNIRDDDLGAIRRLALATDQPALFPEEIIPLSKELWNHIQAMAMREPHVVFANQNEIIRQLAPLFKLSDAADLILPLWLDDNLQGALTLKGTQDGQEFTAIHFQYLASLTQPLTLVLAQALTQEKLKRLQTLFMGEDRMLDGEYRLDQREPIIGQEGGMANVMQLVKQVAPLNNTVLLLGETGTGKEIVANAIHYSSGYKDGPFIKVNCGAIPEHLIDSELFGHERGAFTGAVAEKRGHFERANKGTIFLDEIGELPLQAQIRLLRVLQNREIERVGGHKALPIDIRVIAATHRNLESMVEENTFREDLWFRLNIFPIIIPPLRQRKEDIPSLVLYFLEKKILEMGIKDMPAIAPGALERLMRYNWPGNVRELENLVERELILHRWGLLSFDSLPTAVPPPRHDVYHASLAEKETGLLRLEDVVIQHITKALTLSKGKINGPGGAAQLLDIHPNTLRARMDRLGMHYGRKKQ